MSHIKAKSAEFTLTPIQNRIKFAARLCFINVFFAPTLVSAYAAFGGRIFA